MRKGIAMIDTKTKNKLYKDLVEGTWKHNIHDWSALTNDVDLSNCLFELVSKDSKIWGQIYELLSLLPKKVHQSYYIKLVKHSKQVKERYVAITCLDDDEHTEEVAKALEDVLLDDPKSDIRAYAAETLVNSYKYDFVIPALIYARDHDFKKDYEGNTVARIAEYALDTIHKAEL
jgi:hypothetical protein